MFNSFRNLVRNRGSSAAGYRQTLDETENSDASCVLTSDTVNSRVVKAQYAVRGAVVKRALEIESDLADPIKRKDLQFDKVVYCNIGNPQRLGQKPITFARQVLALATCPELLDNTNVTQSMPQDVVARARHYLDCIPGGTGAYTHSQGVKVILEEIAELLYKRDGFKVQTKHIFITNGASPAIQNVIQLLIRSERDALLLPVPEYPLYSASVTLNGGKKVGYYLDESKGWGLDVNELRRAISQAKSKGLYVRGLMVTNPGNPTGQCLSRDNMVEIIEFCVQERIVLMADEVYQENIWQDEKPFLSFKRVASEMGVLNSVPLETPKQTLTSNSSHMKSLELFSFHSISKGFFGECGRRGGFLEVAGCSDEINNLLYKLASVNLCSNVDGQLVVGMMCNPPREGDESYELYIKERSAILHSLKRRAKLVHAAFSEMEGVTCNAPEGALYMFPQLTIPAKASEYALQQNIAPDAMYCLEMLQETGIVIVPGSGFGQQGGTYHFRATILPPESEMQKVLEQIQGFHAGFMERYR